MKSFKQILESVLEYAPEATSEVEIMPEINGDSDDPKEVKLKKKRVKKESASDSEYVLEIDGVEYDLQEVKMDGVDDNGNTKCWKGYKKKGTKVKGGKEVNNCVKAGFEPEGEQIAEKKLDPVGKEDGDVDNDGDKDKSDKYLMNRRRAIAKAIGKKKK